MLCVGRKEITSLFNVSRIYGAVICFDRAGRLIKKSVLSSLND